MSHVVSISLSILFSSLTAQSPRVPVSNTYSGMDNFLRHYICMGCKFIQAPTSMVQMTEYERVSVAHDSIWMSFLIQALNLAKV